MRALVILAVVVAGCYHPLHPMSDAQRTAPVLGRFACIDPHHANRAPVEVRDGGPAGPFVVAGTEAITNRWSDDRYEHFFTIDEHHLGATEFVRLSDAMYRFDYFAFSENLPIETRTFPDGTVRPVSLPSTTWDCLPAERGATHPLTIKATPVPASGVVLAKIWHRALCKAAGSQVAMSLETLAAEHWTWMPSVIIADPDRHFVSFGGPDAFRIDSGDDKAFAIGPLVATAHWNTDDTVEILATLPTFATGARVTCLYR